MAGNCVNINICDTWNFLDVCASYATTNVDIILGWC